MKKRMLYSFVCLMIMCAFGVVSFCPIASAQSEEEEEMIQPKTNPMEKVMRSTENARSKVMIGKDNKANMGSTNISGNKVNMGSTNINKGNKANMGSVVIEGNKANMGSTNISGKNLQGQ